MNMTRRQYREQLQAEERLKHLQDWEDALREREESVRAWEDEVYQYEGDVVKAEKELNAKAEKLRELDAELAERLVDIESAERSYTDIHQQYAALKFAVGGLVNYHNAHGSTRTELADDINKELETFHG